MYIKNISIVATGRMHTPYPSLAISHKNYQESLAYFSHLAPLVLFFFTKKQSQKGGAWHNAPSKYAQSRAVAVGGPSVYRRGGQNFKLSTKAAVFKRVSFIGGAKHVDWIRS